MKSIIWRGLGILVLAALVGAAHAGAKEDIQADIQAGRWSQADARLEKVLQQHPDNALAHYWLAQVKWREGAVAQAREHLAQAKRLDPQHHFAGDAAALAKFEQTLQAAEGRVAAPRERDASAARIAPERSAATTSLSTEPARTPVEPASSGGHGWLIAGLVALVAFIVWASRSARRRQRGGELEQLRAKLQEAISDLRDAGRAIDTRSDLSMEQRLALSDRVLRAQGDVTAHLETLGSRTDLAASHDLLRRVRDIAAEVRGEPRPSELEAQRAMEAQRAAGAPMGMPAGGPGVARPGLGGAGAALGGLAAGVVLGELMSGSAHARTHDEAAAGSGYTPIERFDPGHEATPGAPDLDLGGSGDAGWDDGGGDFGGGGDFD
jgi:tetratricopeptide (TPR) repeat protein